MYAQFNRFLFTYLPKGILDISKIITVTWLFVNHFLKSFFYTLTADSMCSSKCNYDSQPQQQGLTLSASYWLCANILFALSPLIFITTFKVGPIINLICQMRMRFSSLARIAQTSQRWLSPKSMLVTMSQCCLLAHYKIYPTIFAPHLLLTHHTQFEDQKWLVHSSNSIVPLQGTGSSHNHSPTQLSNQLVPLSSLLFQFTLQTSFNHLIPLILNTCSEQC